MGRAAGSFLKCISSVNASYKMGVTSPIALFFFPQQVLKKIKKEGTGFGAKCSLVGEYKVACPACNVPHPLTVLVTKCRVTNHPRSQWLKPASTCYLPVYSMSQESRSSPAGWLWFRVSQEGVIEEWAGLQSAESCLRSHIQNDSFKPLFGPPFLVGCKQETSP